MGHQHIDHQKVANDAAVVLAVDVLLRLRILAWETPGTYDVDEAVRLCARSLERGFRPQTEAVRSLLRALLVERGLSSAQAGWVVKCICCSDQGLEFHMKEL